MKHQGTYGFTYDSKAEEWEAWCASVWEHHRPSDPHGKDIHQDMWGEYYHELALGHFHSPAQPQNTAETCQPTGRLPTWPLWALIGFFIVGPAIAALFIF